MSNAFSVSVIENDSFHDKDISDRCDRMMFTPLGSRVMLPEFGSKIHENIDKTLTQRRTLALRRDAFECFFDENYVPWDKDLYPTDVSATSGDSIGEVSMEIIFMSGIKVRYGS